MSRRVVRLGAQGLMIAMMFMAVKTGLSQGSAQVVPLDKLANARLQHVKAELETYKGRRSLRVTDDAKQTAGDVERLLILPETDFQDGIIELEMTGDVLPAAIEQARGFVGLAFRVAPAATKYECFYVRPTNGRADDQVRRNHSTQYVSHPEFPWYRLRKEFPEKYESYVDLVPGEWTKIKIEVRGRNAKLYVHGSTQPVLLVNDLKLGEAKGAIALWIGTGTVAHFAKLRVTHWKN